MDREKAEKLLAALIFDDLDEASRAEALAYLQQDDELRERLADMRMAFKVTSDAVQHGPAPVLNQQRLKRLARLAKQGRRGAKIVLFRRLGAIAALLIVGVSAAFLGILPRVEQARMASMPSQAEYTGHTSARAGLKEHYKDFAETTRSATPESFGLGPVVDQLALSDESAPAQSKQPYDMATRPDIRGLGRQTHDRYAGAPPATPRPSASSFDSSTSLSLTTTGPAASPVPTGTKADTASRSHYLSMQPTQDHGVEVLGEEFETDAYNEPIQPSKPGTGDDFSSKHNWRGGRAGGTGGMGGGMGATDGGGMMGGMGGMAGARPAGEQAARGRERAGEALARSKDLADKQGAAIAGYGGYGTSQAPQSGTEHFGRKLSELSEKAGVAGPVSQPVDELDSRIEGLKRRLEARPALEAVEGIVAGKDLAPSLPSVEVKKVQDEGGETPPDVEARSGLLTEAAPQPTESAASAVTQYDMAFDGRLEEEAVRFNSYAYGDRGQEPALEESQVSQYWRRRGEETDGDTALGLTREALTKESKAKRRPKTPASIVAEAVDAPSAKPAADPTESRQVFLDTKIVMVDKEELKNLGVEWDSPAEPPVQAEIEAAEVESETSAPMDTPAPAEVEEDGFDLPPASRFKTVPVNPWVLSARDHLSTFALDVDTASYTLCRRYINQGYLPPAGAVRMEEFINAFDYNYAQRDKPTFAVHAQAAQSPFARPGQDLILLKLGVKARTVGRDQQRPAHLVLVVDASASMGQADRLPLVQYGLKLMVKKLSPADRVSLVTCAQQARLYLEAKSAQDTEGICRAIDAIQASGTTNLLAGLKLGYATARRLFVPGQVNHVVLCSDGVANVGQTEAEAVLQAVAADRKQGITITSVGVGFGTYNDELLEALANRGDGSYVFLDSKQQAQRVFVDQLCATLQGVAKDARIQVDFNAQRVRRYRLIGYENRDIEDKRFRDDTVDAGEVGSGQCSTALYELELAGDASEALGTVFVRYRDVQTNQIQEIARPLSSDLVNKYTVEEEPRFFLAAGVARFAEWLRQSEHVQQGDLPQISRILEKVSRALPLDRDVRALAELTRQAEHLPRAP